MFHIVFKEIGIQIDDEEKGVKIARALLNEQYKGPILAYVEFDGPEHMLTFFKLLSLLRSYGDIEKLEEGLINLSQHYTQLRDLINKTLQETKVVIDIDGKITEVNLKQLMEKVEANGYDVKLEIEPEKEKINLIFRTRL